MFELRGQPPEVRKKPDFSLLRESPRQGPSLVRFPIEGASKRPHRNFPDIKVVPNDHDEPPKERGFYSFGEATTDVTVQVTLGGKDLGDGLVATAAEVIVVVDPTGIVRAFRIAGAIYRAVFGSSKERSNPSTVGRAEPRAEQDLATEQTNTVSLFEEMMRSAEKAAAEAFRQHLAYLKEQEEKKRKKRSMNGEIDLGDHH